MSREFVTKFLTGHWPLATAHWQLINMHELSIALSMIEMATEEAERHGSERVTALYLKLGPLSGVVKDALLFSYEVACNGTPLEGSRLVIEDVPVVIYCRECQAERELESIQRFCCPVCGELSSEVVRGRELEFVAMELADSAEESEDAAMQLRELAVDDSRRREEAAR